MPAMSSPTPPNPTCDRLATTAAGSQFFTQEVHRLLDDSLEHLARAADVLRDGALGGDDADGGSARLLRRLRRAEASLAAMAERVDDLQGASATEGGPGLPEVTLQQLADRVGRVFTPTLAARGIELRVSTDPGVVHTPVGGLYPAVAAAINALGRDAADPGTPRPPRIEVHLGGDRDRIVLYIIGVGLTRPAFSPERAVLNRLLDQVTRELGGRLDHCEPDAACSRTTLTLTLPTSAAGAVDDRDGHRPLRLAA